MSKSFLASSQILAADVAVAKQPIQHTKRSGEIPGVGLCAIMTTESARYLDEWLDYYLFAVHFDVIYIYDNSPQNDLQQFGRRKNDKGKVHIRPWRPKQRKGPTQDKAYTDCVKQQEILNTNMAAKTNTTNQTISYLAFFDDDEFLVLKEHDSVGAFLRDTCTRENGCGSISIHWNLYGSAGHQDYAPGIPLTYRFQLRENQTDPRIKSIVHVPDFVRVKSVHAVETTPGTYQINTRQQKDVFGKTTGAASALRVSDVAVLNHYKYKSIQEYRHKTCKRGRVGGNFRPCNDTILKGDVQDDSAWRILIQSLPEYQKRVEQISPPSP